MKNNIENNQEIEKTVYIAPSIEVIEVKVEQGFGVSGGPDASSLGGGIDENNYTW